MSASPTLPTSRSCPFCAEAISPAAKLCPRCRQWLTLRSLRNPAVGASLVTIAMIVSFLILCLVLERTIGRTFYPPPYYTEFPGALEVLEPRLNWVATKDGPRIYITGLLTNRSPVAWSSIEFECRFFNAAGAMVDAASARCGLTISSNDDSAFRAVVAPGAASNDYRSFKISVSTARNSRSLW